MAQKERDFIGQLVDFYGEANKDRVQNLQSTLGTISTLMTSNDKTLFTIGKAAAIATATIDGVLAVQKALASAPPPFNIVLAAITGVAAAVNVAKIASQQPPKFAEGGFVPGNRASGDQVTVKANSRELMLNMEQQASLFNMIKSGNGGGGGNTYEFHHYGDVDSEARQIKMLKGFEKMILRRGGTLRLSNA